VAAWVPVIFSKFYLLKNYKIANISTTTIAVEKNKHWLGIIKILEIF
jgi:hypothetical protein